MSKEESKEVKVSELELERNVMAIDRKKYPANKLINPDDLLDLVMSGEFVGVDHKERTKFLKDNGYEVNHKNMIDPDLSINPNA